MKSRLIDRFNKIVAWLKRKPEVVQYVAFYSAALIGAIACFNFATALLLSALYLLGLRMFMTALSLLMGAISTLYWFEFLDSNY